MGDLTAQRVWSRATVLFSVGMLAWGVLALAADTWPNCSFRCTAKDVALVSIYAVVPGGACEPGGTSTADIYGRFTASANRYAVILIGDLHVEGGATQHLQQCAGDLPAGTTDVLLTSVTWPCGRAITLGNINVSWSTNQETCADAKCAGRGAQCSTSQDLAVSTPIVVDFTSNSPQCLGTAITFTNRSTGGAPPLAYEWDFGDGGTSTQVNPSHTYAATGTYTVTLTVRDGTGGTDSHSRTVAVSSLPIATATNDGPYCPGKTIQLSASRGGSYSWTGPGGFTSTQQNPTIPSASAAKAGTYTVTVSASGCTAQASTTVVVDSTPPVLVVPTNRTVTCGSSTDPTTTGQATATDNLDPSPTVTSSDISSLSGCGGTGTIARTWKATDACGNVATGVQTITVADTTPPTLTLPLNVTVQCGGSTGPSSTGTATATDACTASPAITSSDVTSLTGCGGTSTITRTWKATDACGNVATGVQTITVVDTTAPSLTVPASITVECGHSTEPSATGQALATDACGTAILSHSDAASLTGCNGTGTITRTWRAVDACGNVATSVQTITVVDTTAPSLTVPASLTVECGHSTEPSATGQALATDACGTVTISHSDLSSLSGCDVTGTITRTWKATDACGNVATGVQTITVADTTAPNLTVPASMTVDCGHSTDPSATGQATANETCGAATITYSDAASLLGCSGTGTISRTWQAVDACGNVATGVQTITVVDAIPPSLTVPAGVTVECGDSTDPSATGQALATDACGTVTISHSDLSSLSGCNGTGTIARTWRAADACGNVATGLQTITVVDAIPPSLTVPADATVQSGQPTDPSATGQASATDDCTLSPLITYVDQANLTGPGGSGTVTRTWTATDACGNVATGVQRITVVVGPPPPVLVLRIPPDVTVGTEDPTDPSSTGQATTSDTCPTPPTLTYSDEPNLTGCDRTGTILRTWTAADACGNSTSGVQTITVADTVFPVLTVPSDVTVDCGEPTDPSATGTAAATDPHGDEDYSISVTYTDQVDRSGCGGTGTILRTWEATEACGNSVTGTQTITLVDRTPPTLTVPADVTVDPGESTAPAATGTATATDSCTAVTVSYTDQSDLTGCEGTGRIVRTWTATDTCGNAATGVQTITVADTTLPVLTVPADVTVECGQPTDPSATGTATASDPHADEESPANVTYTDEVDLAGCGGTGTILRTWKATEECGNSVTVTQTITVVDAAAPTLLLPPDVTIECHHSPAPALTGRALAADACGGSLSTSYEDAYSLSGCDATGTIVRTWRAVDPCGNVTTGTQTITVIHTTPPVLVVPPDVTIQCHDTTTPSATGQATASSDCGSAATLTYTDVPSLTGCDGTGTIARTWRAVDGCGNVASALQTIAVVDTTPPVLVVPPNVVIQCGQPVDPSATGQATAVDDCDPHPAATYSDVPSLTGCAGTITRTWQAVDGCGNATAGVQTITVQETPPPVTLSLTVPLDVTLPCGHNTDPSATGEAAAAGNCGGPITITYGDVSALGGSEGTGTGTVTRTWRAEDACGNVKSGVQTITVMPSAPVLVVPADVTIECGHAVDPSETGTASVVDPCGGNLPVTFTDSPPSPGDDGTVTIVRTWRSVDACGNVATGDQQITFVLCAPPRIVISEVAWAGTPVSPEGEWIELANLEEGPVDLSGWTLRWVRKQIRTPSDRIWREVPLRGSIEAWEVRRPIEFVASPENPGAWWVRWNEGLGQGFYLLERGTDEAIANVEADLLYDQAIPLNPDLDLEDIGEVLELVDPYGRVVDTANADHPERDGWAAGDLTTTGTMERTDLLREDLDENWHTNLGLWTWGVNSEGGLVLGTARRENSPLLEDVSRALAAGPIELTRGTPLRVALPAAPGGESVPARLRALLSRPGEVGIASLAGVVAATGGGVTVQIDTSGLPLGRSFLWLRYGGGDVLLVHLELTP